MCLGKAAPAGASRAQQHVGLLACRIQRHKKGCSQSPVGITEHKETTEKKRKIQHLLFLITNSSSDAFLSVFLFGRNFFMVFGLLLESYRETDSCISPEPKAAQTMEQLRLNVAICAMRNTLENYKADDNKVGGHYAFCLSYALVL